jgi:hypothetical protein
MKTLGLFISESDVDIIEVTTKNKSRSNKWKSSQTFLEGMVMKSHLKHEDNYINTLKNVQTISDKYLNM